MITYRLCSGTASQSYFLLFVLLTYPIQVSLPAAPADFHRAMEREVRLQISIKWEFAFLREMTALFVIWYPSREKWWNCVKEPSWRNYYIVIQYISLFEFLEHFWNAKKVPIPAELPYPEIAPDPVWLGWIPLGMITGNPLGPIPKVVDDPKLLPWKAPFPFEAGGTRNCWVVIACG